jgi:Tfp pilus assembly protein PilP
MRSAINLGIGLLLVAAMAPGLWAHMNLPAPGPWNGTTEQAGQQPSKPGAQPPAKPAVRTPVKPATQAPATPASAKPAAQAPANAATQTPTKPAAQTPAKPGPATAAAKPVAKSAKPTPGGRAKQGAILAGGPTKKKAPSTPPVVKAVERPAGPAGAPKEAAESEVKAVRRDPFESLLARSMGKGENKNLPPGKAGLQVSTLRLDGIVKAPNGMIAVVSNPQSRTYFLREGDHLYDGSVDKISMDGVSFHEEGKDAFGKPVERQVSKRIYSTSSGEQQ